MLTQLVEEVEFRRWTLLLNEILKLIIGSNNASDVVRAKEASAQHKANKADGAGGEEKKEERERSSGMPPRGSGMKGDSPGDAFSIKKKRHFSRHPRFGGQYLVQRMGLTRLCDTVKEDPSLQLHQVRESIGFILYFCYGDLSFLRSFVPSFLRSFVPSFLRSFVPSFLRSFVPSFLRSFVPSFLRSFVPSFLRSFVPSFLRSFVPSFLRSFAPSFLCFFFLSDIFFSRQNDLVKLGTVDRSWKAISLQQ